jgi:DNA-binding ferritin-like protein
MPALAVARKRWSPFEVIVRWWNSWTGMGPDFSELRCCAEDEVKRIATDVGLSAEELRQLARSSPHSADLMLERLAALDLDRKEVAQVEPQIFHDMQRVCTLCETRRQCARDLAQDPNDPEWEHYCPNVETLKLLNSLPWESRREW